MLSVENTQINELTSKHGETLREWWRERFGFDYDCLTGSEARYLIRTPSADRIQIVLLRQSKQEVAHRVKQLVHSEI